MNAYRICFLFLLLACFAARAADDADIKVVAKAKTEEINNALVKGDYAKVADLTHPKVVQLMGGRDKMVAVLETSIKKMKAKGFALQSAKVENSSDPVTAGAEMFVVVPFALTVKVPDGRLVQKGFVIGVSGDKGKTWVFVDGNDLKKVKLILPDLPDKLKLPEKETPVFEKE